MKLAAKTVTKVLAISLMLVAGVAVAKEGVTDPTVKAREAIMATNGLNAKVLADMAGGKTPFDAAAAAVAKAAIAAVAADIPVKFEPQASDPLTAAKPEIWANWADFKTKATALATAAAAMDTASLEGVQAGMAGLGEACKACHTTYKLAN